MKRSMLIFFFQCTILLLSASCSKGQTSMTNQEEHRLQVHFSPKANWINDPNGMVYHKGIYHLFFQYHPASTIWGPMHWGHATSKDMVNWKEEAIALYPDSLGMIFSGSTVADINNTSGFGKDGKMPLVAIFTHHNAELEKTSNKFQNQSLAYSLDDGKTWTKYAGNPVVPNPGITDFRDPKVSWYEAGKKWVMTLATKDRITFYSSPNLKDWKKESEFGAELGGHGGVWECPDLFQLDHNGKKVWVLLVSINPGGPNKGSVTQYFIGDFDGTTFKEAHTDTRWMDYGPDNYAGVTFFNTGDRKVLIGWMNNWLYANKVPTEKWRGAMTLPRELKLKQVGDKIFLASEWAKEISKLESAPVVAQNVVVNKRLDLATKVKNISLPCRLDLSGIKAGDLSLVLSNNLGEELFIGYDKAKNEYYIDRTKSGKLNFQEDFASRSVAPRLAVGATMNMSLVLDIGSVELLGDDGLSVLTALFFPNKTYNKFTLKAPGSTTIQKLSYRKLKAQGK
ncbi:MAG: glycoside hydrolase family 32 protein [Ferruginibacter sp.]|nr:glycoside hydrolase family 32 protein [Ferruginibacter sp.]